MGSLSLIRGERYNRRALHEIFGGQWDYGISTPARKSYILLFSTPRGYKLGFEDRWETDDVYRYIGEGQRGEMRFTRGNSAILNHASNGKELHLFREPKDGSVAYEGRFEYLDHEIVEMMDRDARWRKGIVFRLRRTD